MASIRKRGRKYIVRWRDPDGTERIRTVPDFDTAKKLQRDVERTVALGRRWEPADRHALPELAVITRVEGEERITAGLVHDYLADRARLFGSETVRSYSRALALFVAQIRSENPTRRRLTVDLLTKEAVGRFYDQLIADGRAISTARLRVTPLQGMWEWGYEDDRYGDYLGRPRRLEMPTPVYTPARAPTWAEMDACIWAAWRMARRKTSPGRYPNIERMWRYRLAILLRFTGLRVDQAMRLTWDDVDIDRGTLVVRGELGKSRQERAGRIVPLSEHLLEHLAGWGVREGWLVAPNKTDRGSISWRMARIWSQSGVPEAVWKGHPHHTFRKGFTSSLKRLGADTEAVEYLVGHSTKGARAHYLDPDALPLRDVVALIPALTPDVVLAIKSAKEM